MISLPDLSLLINRTTIHPGVHLGLLSKFFSICLLNVSQCLSTYLHLLYHHSGLSHLFHLLPKLLLKPPNLCPGFYFSPLHPLTPWPGIIFQKYKYSDVTPLKILQWCLLLLESKLKSISWPMRPWSGIVLPCQPHLAPCCFLLCRVGFLAIDTIHAPKYP